MPFEPVLPISKMDEKRAKARPEATRKQTTVKHFTILNGIFLPTFRRVQDKTKTSELTSIRHFLRFLLAVFSISV
jgi:hypothetical protein